MSEDDSEYGGLYENGYWEWDEKEKQLKFESNASASIEDIILTKPSGIVHFREDVDLFEQMRYKHRYQRKVKFGQREVITIQDVKDVVIFTAPMNIMSEKLINMLHRPTTERFIRALILYCQYYLQIVDIMSERKKQLKKKLRTPESNLIEDEYRDNLCDLRLLVAKEYCMMSIGAADCKYYHHMGVRRQRSLTDQDALFYETLMRIFIQMVWLALGRRAFNQIELEVNRLFKTEIFNSVEHNLQTKYIAKMSPEERKVLLGNCLRYDKKVSTRSPLVNEVFCHRRIDYRLMSLGVVKHNTLTPRFLFLQRAIAAPEETFEANKIVVGVLGQQRSCFDVMLNPLSHHHHQQHKSSYKVNSIASLSSNFNNTNNMKKSGQYGLETKKLYSDIIFPPKEEMDEILDAAFPVAPAPVRRCNMEQRERWINRFCRILIARKSTIC